MFSTPVGGALLLAVLFTFIGLYLLVLYIVEGIFRLSNRREDGSDKRIDRWLDRREEWYNKGMIGPDPQLPNKIFSRYATYEQRQRDYEVAVKIRNARELLG